LYLPEPEDQTGRAEAAADTEDPAESIIEEEDEPPR